MVAKLMLLHAETPMHPGAGSALGTVDLPVARERHTGFPLIPGSSLKGVLRDKCANGNPKDEKVFAVFGPDTEGAAKHAGALSLTDARLLAFPLRSLSGLFAWVTCPAVLERFLRDLRIVGGNQELQESASQLVVKAKSLTENQALVSQGTGLRANGSLVLEEFDYNAIEEDAVKVLGEKLEKKLGEGVVRLSTHMAVISDNAFGYSTKFATEVMARIALDSGTKTVKDGALFYEEFLPAGTVFYSLTLAEAPKGESVPTDLTTAEHVIGYIEAALEPDKNLIQIGANATTGKGLCTAVLV
jgi:CRISPR-associated protein Cmr4